MNVLSFFKTNKQKPFGQTPLAAALLILGSLLAVALFELYSPRSAGCDDWTMSYLLSGQYPNGGTCLFMNTVLAQFIFWANSTIGIINWFFLIEGLTAALSLALSLVLISREISFGYAMAMAGFAFCFLMLSLTYENNFTVVAAVACFAGILSLSVGTKKRDLPIAILGAVFFALGYMWRPNAGLLSLPFLVFALATVAFFPSKGITLNKNSLASFAKSIALVLIPLVLLMGINAAVWSSDPWKDWDRTNNAQSVLNDYPFLPYEEISDQLSELGVSETDYWLLHERMVADPSIFTTEKIEAVADLQRTGSIGLLSAVKTYVKGRLGSDPAFLAALAAVFFLALLHCRGIRRLIPLVSLIFTACCGIYFVAIGRFPYRVEITLWMGWLAVCLVCYILDGKPGGSSTQKKPTRYLSPALGAIGCAAMLSCCLQAAPYIDLQNISDYRYEQHDRDVFAVPTNLATSTENYIDSDSIFIWDSTTFYAIVPEAMKNRLTPSKEFFDKNFCLGNWTYRSPITDAHANSLSSSSLFEAFATEKNVYFVSCFPDKADHICEFLKEYYCPNATIVYRHVGSLKADYATAKAYLIHIEQS